MKVLWRTCDVSCGWYYSIHVVLKILVWSICLLLFHHEKLYYTGDEHHLISWYLISYGTSAIIIIIMLWCSDYWNIDNRLWAICYWMYTWYVNSYLFVIIVCGGRKIGHGVPDQEIALNLISIGQLLAVESCF